MWLTPTEEELFARYNPELQRRSLENREQKQEEFDNFVRRLKEYSKSDKPSEYPFSLVIRLDGVGGRRCTDGRTRAN